MRTQFFRRHSILIVDDNPENIRIIGSILKEEGYQVQDARGGLHALQRLTHDPEMHDLLVMDVNLHDINGFELYHKIRQSPALKEMPVIFITNGVDQEKTVEGFGTGDHSYISKPFNVRQLISTVNSHIELKENRDHLRKINHLLEEKVKERTLELEQAYKNLEDANRELAALDQAKVDFLDIISHEINTPLNGIIGFTGLLKDQLQSTEYFDMIECLSESAQRLNDFAQKSLIIARIRTSPQKYRKEPINIRKQVEDLVEKMSREDSGRSLQMVSKLPEHHRGISGNEELLRTCIVNLLKNAMHYSPAGEEIVVTLTEEEQYICLEIRDKGPGFTDTALRARFKPFSPGEKYIDKNKGLGLALSKMIMDFHHGEIRLSNKKSGGASVLLRFPSLPNS